MKGTEKSISLLAAIALLYSINGSAATGMDAGIAEGNQTTKVASVKNMEEMVAVNGQNRDKDVALPFTTHIEHSSSTMIVGLLANDDGLTILGPITSYDLIGNDC